MASRERAGPLMLRDAAQRSEGIQEPRNLAGAATLPAMENMPTRRDGGRCKTAVAVRTLDDLRDAWSAPYVFALAATAALIVFMGWTIAN